MKKKNLGFLSLLLAAFLLGSCGNTSGSSSSEASASSAENTSSEISDSDADGGHLGGHLNVAMFWVSTGLDPADGYNGWVLSRIGAGETLVRLDQNAEAEPAIAESWEQTDDNTWVFHIREGVTFSNVKPVDAAACKASIERAFSINSRAEEYFTLDSIEADGQTLTIHTAAPTGAIVHNLCEPLFTIVDTSVDEETMDTAPVSTGPYVVTAYSPETSVELVRNDSYWDGTPGLSTISVFAVPDSDARVLAMQSGEADLTTTIDNTNLSLFSDESRYTVSLTLGPRTNVVYYNNARPLLSDADFRRAVSCAADTATYAGLIGCAPGSGLYSEALACGRNVENPYAYNPDMAAELLNNLGYVDTDGDGIREADGENISLEYYIAADHGSSDSAIIAQAFQTDLKKVGIGVELIQTENMSDIRSAGQYDFCSANDSTAPTADPEIFLVQHYLSGGSANFENYKNTEVDGMIEELTHIFDPDERQLKAREISETILSDAASLYVGYIYGNTVTTANVKGALQFPIDYYIITKDITIE